MESQLQHIKNINSNNCFLKLKLTAGEDRKDTNTSHRPDDTDDLMQWCAANILVSSTHNCIPFSWCLFFLGKGGLDLGTS